ncbi:hypothetical protein SAMN05428970_1157 [Agromyces sp. CF514]|uniref:hypothetical protein n=1 Tax=Agromyces sp. CF514 TaxID=1881031 RepID=UPI0008EE6BD1|nr:hypothetical protein [Agromyces sp. CF514]SFR71296.1 hypothetical protein SAMN05428970_1157 [Agromyces sp. CF514]
MGEHVIRTTGDGELKSPTVEGVDQIVQDAVAAGSIVIYFHGGLVTEKSGVEIAERLGKEFTGAGAYPIHIVWQSGWYEVIRNNLFEIAKEELFDRLLKRVVSWAVGKARVTDGGRGVALPPEQSVQDELARRKRKDDPEAGAEPFADEPTEHAAPLTAEDEDAFVRDIQTDQDLNRALAGALAASNVAMNQEGSRGVPDVPPEPTRMDPAVLAEIGEGIGPDGARGGLSIVAFAKKAFQVLTAVVGRFRDGTDSGMYPTVVDELLRAFYIGDAGGALWDAMKQETADTFAADGNRGGRLLLDALSRELPADGSVKITLIGHSTGAVFIDNLLREVVRRREKGDSPLPEKTRFQVLLLAPASTTTHFAETLAIARPLIDRFRVFTMDDEHERADRVAGAVYPRSLLYLVSGALERDSKEASAMVPVLGMARYFDSKSAGLKKLVGSPLGTSAKLKAVGEYLAQQDFVVLSPSADGAKDGFRTGATSHGSFDNEPLVVASVVHLIRDYAEDPGEPERRP